MLEHVPNPKTFMSELSKLGKRVLIKLPIEKCFLDNWMMRKKTYPSLRHPDGHLREFNFDSVHEFVTRIGLIPLDYSFYIYGNETRFPLSVAPKRPLSRVAYSLLRSCAWACRWILPQKVYRFFSAVVLFVLLITHLKRF